MVKKAGSGLRVGTNKVLGPNWSRSEETMLLAPDERVEWVQYALPPSAKSIFKFLQNQEVKGCLHSVLIEIKNKVCFLGNKEYY